METNHLTGEPRLLTDSNGARVFDAQHDANERFHRTIEWLDRCRDRDYSIVSWRTFDHISLFRVFIESLHDDAKRDAIRRHGIVNPCVQVDDVRLSVFKTMLSIEFFRGGKWRGLSVLDASRFYNYGIERTAREEGIVYSKGAQELHLIDWERYALPDSPLIVSLENLTYRDGVRWSNLLDARTTRDLMKRAQNNFHDLFQAWPRLMSSGGSVCKSALATVISPEEYVSINWRRQCDAWARDHDESLIRELWSMTHEAYSGGLIDVFRLGTFPEAYMSDIASAYPAAIVRLPDLAGSRIETGTGRPRFALDDDPRDLVLTRCVVTIPDDAWHTVSYRIGTNDSKARVTGTFRATFTLNEREWLAREGATFEDEAWVAVRCGATRSPLATACNEFLRMREGLRGSSAERVAKEAANSLYGISYEMIPEHGEDLTFTGFKTGELYNPLLATFITAFSRLRLVAGLREITNRGGSVIAAMTDSITWTGNVDDLPPDFGACGVTTGVREKKTLGYYESPEKITNYLCAGTGRYEYVGAKGRVLKARGYRFPEGVEPSLRAVLSDARDASREAAMLETGLLVSPGIVRSRPRHYSWRDLGRIVREPRELKPFTLGGKRWLARNVMIGDLLDGIVETQAPRPPPIMRDRQITTETPDNTLPELRERFLAQVRSRERARKTQQLERRRNQEIRARKWLPERENARKAHEPPS